MINLTKQDVQDAARRFMSEKDSMSLELVKTVGSGVGVYHNDIWLHRQGMILSEASKLLTSEGELVTVIIVDDYFMSAPQYVQDVLVFHELGHIENGDLDNISPTNTLKRWLLMNVGIVQKIELEADKFAAKRVGKEETLKALSWMYENVQNKLTRREMKARMRAVKRLRVA